MNDATLKCSSLEDSEVWLVPVKDIVAHWNPFAAWMDTAITTDEVNAAINSSEFELLPLSLSNTNMSGFDLRGFHVRRIAHLVVAHDTNPIEIDIGVPSLGHMPLNGVFDFIDGNHRLCAAIVRCDEQISVTFDGQVNAFPEIFPNATRLK